MMPINTKSSFQSALLEALFQLDDECISVWERRSLKPVFINPSCLKLFGYPSESEMMECLSFQSLRAEEAGEEKILEILSSIEESGSWDEEVLYKKYNGERFYGRLRITTFESDRESYLLKRIIDIDKQVRVSTQLRKEIQRFEALFQYASMGIILVNREGGIVLANQQARDAFGYSKGEITKCKVEDLIPHRFRNIHSGHRENYASKPQNRPMGQGLDLYAIKKDGTEFPVEISLSNFKNEDDWYVIAFIIDITRRKEIEKTMVRQQRELERINEEIEQLNEELEIKVEIRTQQLKDILQELEQNKEELEKALNKEKELGDLKSRFVSMASHEFRTPLSTILSSASLVAKYQQTEEQDKRDKHIQRIKFAVNNLTDILNEFLSIGRIEEGRIQPNYSDFNVKEQLQLVCNEMQLILKQGQKINCKHMGEEVIRLDLSLLRNILINLISNAVKFSSENATIDVWSETGNDEFKITVRDKGIGIPVEDQKHLFERFFRARNAMNIQGTGLGLHIVSRYVELLRGRIELKSEVEKGSEFICIFKL